MNIKSIERYHIPSYPTHDVLEEHPELLALVPRRWRTNPKVLAAMAGFSLLLAGSVRSQEDVVPLAGVPAPPQVTLTESEARSLIIAEAKRSGIDFKADAESAKLYVDLSKYRAEQGIQTDKARSNKVKIKLTIDGVDKKHKVDYEYISEQDIEQWQKTCPDLKNTYKPGASMILAGPVKDALKKSKPGVKHAVFHSPLGYDREEAKAELRKQVQDFIKWLKAEGVI